jgi:hypothetical protein
MKSHQLALSATTTTFSTPDAIEIYEQSLVKSNRIDQMDLDDYCRKLAIIIKVQCQDMGIKKPPQKEEMTRNADFLRRKYGRLSIRDIKRAFEYYTEGKLEGVKDPSFGTIPLKFICNVLNAYTKHRSKAIVEVRDSRIDERHEPSPEELRLLEQTYWNAVHASYLEYVTGTQIPDYFLTFKTYNAMKDAGLINLSVAEILPLRNPARRSIANKNQREMNRVDAILRKSLRDQQKGRGFRIELTLCVLRRVFADIATEHGVDFDIRKHVLKCSSCK